MISALGLCAAGPARAVISLPEEYTFVGVCSDCTGDGIGVLTLENYVLGESLFGHFESFSYRSNLTKFTIDLGDFKGIAGTLPPTLPSTASVTIEGTGVSFVSETSGLWCTGDAAACGTDIGRASSWRVGGIPEPATWAMLILGFCGLGFVAWRRSRVASSAA
jgi:hypothetical protein